MPQPHLLLMRLFGLILLGSLVAGCGSTAPFKAYDGETRKVETLALIKGETMDAEGTLFPEITTIAILEVDNKATSSSFFEESQSVLVEPGRRYLKVLFIHALSRASGRLWLDAEMGKTYIVKSLSNYHSVVFWIEDEKTGEKVGGIPGGEPVNSYATPLKGK